MGPTHGVENASDLSSNQLGAGIYILASRKGQISMPSEPWGDPVRLCHRQLNASDVSCITYDLPYLILYRRG